MALPIPPQYPDDPDPALELLTVHVSPEERGQSFGLESQTWRRLASACQNVRGLKTIRVPRDGARGCTIEILGRMMLVIRINPEAGKVVLERQGLDDLESHLVVEVNDDRAGWRRIKTAAIYFLGERRK